MSAPLDMLAGPSWRFLLAYVSLRTGVSTERIMARTRAGGAGAARIRAMATVYRHTQLSTPGVGRLFQRDHTTVMHALKVTGGSQKYVDVLLAPDIAKLPAGTAATVGKVKQRSSRAARARRNRRVIRQDYAQGIPTRETAEKLGLARKSVQVIASTMGLVHPRPDQIRRRVPAAMRSDYQVLTGKGKFPARQAAAMLGVQL